jgi:hypothetical protein
VRLSALQKFLLLETYGSRPRQCSRKGFERFYLRSSQKISNEEVQNSITKSLERLIDKGLLIGYGRRTPRKWFIDSVKLTPLGRRQTKKLQGEQQSFPFFKTKTRTR